MDIVSTMSTSPIDTNVKYAQLGQNDSQIHIKAIAVEQTYAIHTKMIRSL